MNIQKEYRDIIKDIDDKSHIMAIKQAIYGYTDAPFVKEYITKNNRNPKDLDGEYNLLFHLTKRSLALNGSQNIDDIDLSTERVVKALQAELSSIKLKDRTKKLDLVVDEKGVLNFVVTTGIKPEKKQKPRRFL